MLIQHMQAEHWPAVSAIYEQGIATGNATFQKSSPEWAQWDAAHLATCRLVALDNAAVIGWAALSPVSARPVYAGVTEVSVYVAESARGLGVGWLLLQSLIDASEAQGIWTLQAGIFPENTASLLLHEKLGFRRIGYRERIGQMDGVWRDTVLLERRSKRVGV